MSTKTEQITGTEDVLDSRDIEARIEALEADERTEEESAELAELVRLRDELSGYAADWRYGCALIADSYMQQYAQETAEDCGMMPKDMGWPCCHIDWDAATDAFKQDYTSAELFGNTYWTR